MGGIDPAQAARDLEEADRRLRRGAELPLPRWQKVVWLLIIVVQNGVYWDLPSAGWRVALMLVLGFGILAFVILGQLRARARPLRIKIGWRGGLGIAVVAVSAYAIMRGVGMGLRALSVPLPFTLSSIVLVVGLWLLLRRWGGSYVERVSRGQW